MRVNIFETALDGHRARYLSQILRALCNRSDDAPRTDSHQLNQVKLLMPESLRGSNPYVEHIRDLEAQFEFCSIAELPRNGKFREEWARLRAISANMKIHPCDRLIIPYGDGLVPLQGLLPRWLQGRCWAPSTRVEAILFRPSWIYPAEFSFDQLYHRMRGFGAKRWPGARLCVLDQNVSDRAQQHIDRYRASVHLMPEMLDEFRPWPRNQAIQWLLQNGYLSEEGIERIRVGTVLGMPGAPSLRKGAVVLTEAFVRCTAEQQVTLLYWDKFPETVNQRLLSKGVAWDLDQRLLFCKKPVCSLAFQALFSLTDAVCLPYQNDRGVSSLYLLSVAHRKRVLCDNRGWLGWAQHRYQHGHAIDCSTPESIASGIIKIIEDPSIPIASESTAEAVGKANNAVAFQAFWASQPESNGHG